MYRLTEEQFVNGAITVGFEMLRPSERHPQEVMSHFVEFMLQIERRNKAMNECVVQLIDKL